MGSCNINFVLCGMIQTFQRVFNVRGYLDLKKKKKKERGEREKSFDGLMFQMKLEKSTKRLGILETKTTKLITVRQFNIVQVVNIAG